SGFEANFAEAEKAQTRYEETDNLHALDDAIVAWERAFHSPDFAASDPHLRFTALYIGAEVRSHRYRATGFMEDLNEAIELLYMAIAQVSPDDPYLPRLWNVLGEILS